MQHASTPRDDEAPANDTPYDDAELDRAIVATIRSDAASVAIRVVGLGLAYVLLALAIHRHQLPAPLVALPWLVEFVALQWLGLLLAARVVDCPKFVASSRRPVLVVVWTCVVLVPMALWLVWDTGAERPDPTLLPARVAEVGRIVVESGLHWALLAMLATLLATTLHEVLRWRRAGRREVFVWTATFPLGFRLVGGLAMLFVVPFALPVASVLAGLIGAGDTLERALDHRAWLTFAALLAIDVFALVVSTLMHRDLASKRR